LPEVRGVRELGELWLIAQSAVKEDVGEFVEGNYPFLPAGQMGIEENQFYSRY
jgi:hypothetical protein